MAIPNTTKLFGDLKTLAMDLTAVVKSGVSFMSLTKIFSVISDLKDIFVDLPAALPELENLSEADASAVTALVYEIGAACLAEFKI